MRNMTVRGRCFLAAGAAAVVCGIQIGERDFVRIGLLAAITPLVAWLLVSRTDRTVWLRRNVSSLQVEAGETAHVEVEVGAAGRRTGLLLLEEELPAALGKRQRFVVEPLATGGQTTLHYLIHTEPATTARASCSAVAARTSPSGSTASATTCVASTGPAAPASTS